MKIKKLLSAILAVCMIFGSVSALAITDKVVFDLTSLGIVSGDENGNLLGDEEITRAEFVKMMINLQGYAEISTMGDSREMFVDIPDGHWAKSYINFAASIGTFDGYPDGTFGPEDKVLLQDCIKTVVRALGYEVVAQQKGGYPNGYIMVAAEKQLTKNISASYTAPAIRGDVMTLLYNALDVNLLQESISGGEAYEESNDTFRSLLANQDEKIVIKGIITANYDTWLIKPITGLRKDEVELDGTVFAVGNTDAADYIGQEVQIYYHENETKNRLEIINVAPTKRNNVVTITADEYMSYSSDRMEYERDGRKEYLTIAPTAQYVYNNRIVTAFNSSYIDVDKGSILAVDNNGDEAYDYIFVSAYESVVVDSVYSNGNLYFKNGFKFKDRNFITLDEEDNDLHFTIENATGEKINYSDIKAGDVLSILSSEDGLQLRVIVSDKTIQGTVTELQEGEGASIDGIYYQFASNTAKSKIHIGDVRALYLNHEDKIVYVTDEGMEDGATKYGYIWTMGTSGSGFGTVQAKILESTTVEHEWLKDDDLTATNLVATLICNNGGVRVVDLNGKVTYNGVSMSAEDFMAAFGSGPVKYQLDSTGKLKTIEDPVLEGGSSTVKMKFNADEKVFGGYEAYGGFVIDENTKGVCVPTNADATDEDLMTWVRITNSSKQYYVQGFDYDENTKTVKFITLSEELKADDIQNIVPGTSKIGLVASATQTTDETGDPVYKVDLYYNKVLESYKTANIVAGKNETISRLKRGDLIYFTTNNNGQLDNAQVIKSLSFDDEAFWEDKGLQTETLFGYVKELSMNDINVTSVWKVHTMTMMLDNGKTEDALIRVRYLPPIYIYDTTAKTVSLGEVSDIRPYTGNDATSDKVFVVRPYGNVSVIVIVR